MHLLDWIGLLATAVAIFGYINHRFIGLPDSIGVTAMGLVLSLLATIVGTHVPGITAAATNVADRIDLAEVILHGMLGVLLFAGALHINLHDLRKQRTAVFVLATVGVIISTVVVGYVGYWLMHLMGVQISLVYCLLFGALISPTDPIAVLGLLKSAGAPKDLEMKITGESLFNDATGVIMFLILLGVASGGTEATASSVGIMLMKEVVGAIVFGLVIGYGAYFLLKGVDSYPVEIFITIAVATAGYSWAEKLHVSAPLAVVVAGLVIGNHGVRNAMSETTRLHLFQFWGLIDELLSLVLFSLIGIKLIALNDQVVPWFYAGLFIPVVLLARYLSVGAPALVLRKWMKVSTHDVSVMTWGGLRGGISVALALSLPQFEGKSLIVTATYAVVLFSLLIQAPTMARVLAFGRKPAAPSAGEGGAAGGGNGVVAH